MDLIMICRFALFSFGILICSLAFSQSTAPAIQTQHSMGGSLDDISYDIIPTQDGGYLVAGGSTSSDGDLLKTTEILHGGNYDFWFLKLDANLNIQWKDHLGGTGSDLARKVLQSSDGGYVVAGSTSSNDVDVSGNHGDYDFWMVKLTSAGSVQWQKCYGGSDYDDFGAVRNTADGGYIMAGGSSSNDGDLSNNHGGSDFWLVKTDANGAIQWQKNYGGPDYEKAADVRVCQDGGYIMAGFSESNSGDVTGNHGDYDVWVVKTDASGNLQWQKSLGGSSYDAANSLLALNDGSFIVCGYTDSNDGDASGNHGDDDVWIVKLDASGNIVWTRCVGGTTSDVAADVEAVGDSSYLFSCYSKSDNGDVGDNYGYWDYWLLKTDLDGGIQWQKNFGGALNDVCYAAKPTPDEGYVLTGYSESLNLDVSGNHGKKDYWVVKLEGLVGVDEVAAQPVVISVYPQPAGDFVYLQIPDEVLQNNKAAKFEFYDITGRNIATQKISYANVLKIDCSKWNSGMYYYRLTGDQQIIASGKIAVE